MSEPKTAHLAQTIIDYVYRYYSDDDEEELKEPVRKFVSDKLRAAERETRERCARMIDSDPDHEYPYQMQNTFDADDPGPDGQMYDRCGNYIPTSARDEILWLRGMAERIRQEGQ